MFKKFNKKVLVTFLALAFIIIPVVSSAYFTDADMAEELQSQIAGLLKQIQELQEKLAKIQGGQTTTWCHTFNTDLGIGSSGDEVSALTTALVKVGVGSERSSNFSASYDEVLASAVSAFQNKYKSEILNPAGLKNPTGYLGGRTRAKLNSLYGCGNTIATPPVQIVCTADAKVCPDGSYVGRSGPKCEFSACPSINYFSPLYITNSSTLPNAKVGNNSYQVILGVSGGPSGLSTNSYNWYVSSGRLPDGITLTASDYGEMIQGTPTVAGTYSFTLSTSYSSQSGSKSFTLTVEPASVQTPAPSIQISATASNQTSQSSISVPVGTTFTISGVPQNIQGLSYYYGTGNPPTGYYSRAFFFDQKFGSNNLCGNNDISNTTWTITCTAKVVGSSYFYIEIYANGQTYRSNTVNVTVPTPTIGKIIPSTTFVTFNMGQGNPPTSVPINLTNSSNVPIIYTISVPNKPAWLYCSYATETLSLSAWGVVGLCAAADASKVSGSGTYSTSLIITGNFEGSPLSIPITLTVTAPTNSSPSSPVISGQTSVISGQSNIYSAVSTDSNGDAITYKFNWGDGKVDISKTTASGYPYSIYHTWSTNGIYTITVSADDGKGGLVSVNTLLVKVSEATSNR